MKQSLKLRLLCLTLIIFNTQIQAQSAKPLITNAELISSYKETKHYTIIYDYKKNEYSKPIKKGPKVGDYLVLKFLNIPYDAKIKGSVVFEDRNIENQERFEKLLGTTTIPTAQVPNGKTSNSDEIKKLEKEIESNKQKGYDTISNNNEEVISLGNDNKLDLFHNNTIKIKTTLSLGKLASQNLKENKVNYNNVDTALEIGMVYNFLKQTKNLANNQKAVNDILFQKFLIDSAIKVNWRKDVELRDALLTSYKTQIGNYEAEENSFKKTTTKDTSFLPFQILNADVTNVIYSMKIGPDSSIRKIHFLNRGGVKIDFSLGFIASKIREDNYKVDFANLGKDSTTKLYSIPTNATNIGFGLLMHIYFRSGTRLVPSITSGLVLNTKDQAINYVLGSSVIIGSEQRFIISGGASFGKVKRLASTLNKNQIYQYKDLPKGQDIPTVDVLKAGFFVSATYNISNLIRKKLETDYTLNL